MEDVAVTECNLKTGHTPGNKKTNTPVLNSLKPTPPTITKPQGILVLTLLAAKIYWENDIASLRLAGLGHILNVHSEFSILNFHFFSRCDS